MNYQFAPKGVFGKLCLLAALPLIAASAAPARPMVPADAPPQPQSEFPLSPESTERAPGVVPGETFSFDWTDSEIFPGTQRTISVYVPHGYDGKTPACVAIFQDKGNYNFETVFDNLIHSGEMPMTIAVIVPPGIIKGAIDPKGTRFNRTFEYDSPGERYADFLLEEILPAVEKQKTANGLPVLLSKSGNDRIIIGGSSGAAAGFNAAWAKPEEFSRVFSAIGSYTGLRGSYEYPTLVHKTEPKALRLFLQSGTYDMWTCYGDWWMANNAMVRALEFAGYEFDYEFGHGRHGPPHATALFPRAMRFLWKDWPQPVQASVKSRNGPLKQTSYPDKRWVQVDGDFKDVTRVRADASGNLYLSSEGGVFRTDANGKNAQKISDGVFWTVAPDGKSWIRSDAAGKVEQVAMNSAAVLDTLATDLPVQTLVQSRTGEVYALSDGKLWLLLAGKAPQLLDNGPLGVSAISINGDGNWLAAFENNTTRGFSYQIEKDGTLNHKQTFYVLHKHDADDHARVRDAASEASKFGLTHTATGMGVQISDANGRSGGIMPLPDGAAAVSLCFGGKDLKTLYVLADDGKLYSRPMKSAGTVPYRPGVQITSKGG